MVYNILVKYKVFFQILPEKKRLIWGANHFVTFIRVFWVAEHHPGSTHLPSAQDLLQVFLCHTIGVVGTECLQCIFFIVCLKISNSFSGLDPEKLFQKWRWIKNYFQTNKGIDSRHLEKRKMIIVLDVDF